MKDKINTLIEPGRAQFCAVGGGEKHPRVKWDEVGRGAGPTPDQVRDSITPLAEAPRVAVQYRAKVKKVHQRVRWR
jgi:hypothetical protein